MALFSDEDYQDESSEKQQPINTLDNLKSGRDLYNDFKKNREKGAVNETNTNKEISKEKPNNLNHSNQSTVQEAGKKTAESSAGAAEKSSVAAGVSSGNATTATASVAATPVIIIIAIIVAVILLIFFIVGLFANLTSFSPFKTAVNYIEESTKSVFSGIGDFFSNFKNFFDDTEWIEADENSYDADNEIDVGYITTYNLINTMLNKSYSKQVNDLVGSYCNENGLDVTITKNILNQKYPHEWEDVYSNVNYTELINILGLGIYSGKYDDYESMKDFLLNEDNWKYFYNIQADIAETEITKQESTEEKKNDSTNSVTKKIKYANITIYPYCKSDLFEALGINKDDICKDNLSYYDMLDVMMMQAKANCTDTNGPRTIYYTLNTDKPLSEWTKSFSSITADEIFADNTTVITGGDNPEVMWKTLKAAGFTDQGAAGVMGNLQAENGFRTNVSAGDQGSIGLCQWRLGRADALYSYASAHNLPVDSIQAQAGYLIYEFPAQTGTNYEKIKNATDTIAACDIVAKYFERCAYAPNYEYWQKKYSRYSWSRFIWSDTCGVYIIDLDKRQNYATLYYNKYAGLE